MIEKRTFGGIVADIIIWIIVGALALSCLMPLMNIVAISLSDNAAVSANLVNIFPIGFNISSYQEIMGDKQFWRSFGISVLRVVLGLSVNITLLVLTAYPLSKSPKFFTGQKVYMSLILFAMLFSGGLIPTFMVVNSLKLTNTIWALILPGAVPLGNVILLMNAFRGVPKSLEEAAMIDGGVPVGDFAESIPAGGKAHSGSSHAVYHSGALERLFLSFGLHYRYGELSLADIYSAAERGYYGGDRS